MMETFVCRDHFSIGARAAVASALGALCLLMALWPNVSFFIETTTINNLSTDWSELVRHIFVYSVPWVFVAWLMFFVGVKLNFVRWPSLIVNLKRSFLYGFLAFLIVFSGVSLVSVISGAFSVEGMGLFASVGNLFSNFYEEVIWRALMVPGCYIVFNNKYAAYGLPALLFGLTHLNYGPGGAAIAAFGALVMTWLYLKTRNLLSPWLYHSLSDIIIG